MDKNKGNSANLPVVYAFDFDGTITTRDTLIEFIRYVRGEKRLLLGLLRYAPMLILMRLRLYPNWKAKQKVFSHFFSGMKIGVFNDYCHSFMENNAERLLRPGAVETIEQALKDKAKVVIISASIEDWVAPFFERFITDPRKPSVFMACTKIEVREETVTGRFISNNCYGSEKVKRLQRLFPRREGYYLIAYGDSDGDKNLLDYADEGYYKHFE